MKDYGLYNKFIVQRTDGRDRSGEKHEHCVYFVLDVDHDPQAKVALLAYADACEERLPRLAENVRSLAGVKGGLPKELAKNAVRVRVLPDRYNADGTRKEQDDE